MVEQNKEDRKSKEVISNRGSIIVKDMGEETVLYNPDTRKIHILNNTALFIWQLCDGRHSIEDISAAVVAKFCQKGNEKDEKRIEQDVRSIIDNFISQSVIPTCPKLQS